MKNLWLLIGSLALTLFAVVAVAVLFTKKANAPVLPSDPAIVIGEETNIKGNADAKITISEFSDFQCPACRAAQPLLDSVMALASDSARLVFRHYPLRSLHPNAFAAAKAAEAAAEQQKFWEYHDLLFEKQTDWEEERDPTAKFESYAQELGLNLEKFKQDYANRALEQRITQDEQDGTALGVNATPTFYVNNVKTDVSELLPTVQRLLSE